MFTIEVGAVEVRAGEVRPGEARVNEIRAGEACAVEIRAGKARASEIDRLLVLPGVAAPYDSYGGLNIGACHGLALGSLRRIGG
jgi:hypothetical protein